MKRLLHGTSGGKAGTIDGLNLFFGALIGANLGTTQNMPVLYYLELVFLLAGAVIVLRIVSTSPRRIYMLAGLALYAVFAGMVLLWPPFQPKGVPNSDLQRLAITFGSWMFLVVATELMPIKDVRGD